MTPWALMTGLLWEAAVIISQHLDINTHPADWTHPAASGQMFPPFCSWNEINSSLTASKSLLLPLCIPPHVRVSVWVSLQQLRGNCLPWEDEWSAEPTDQTTWSHENKPLREKMLIFVFYLMWRDLKAAEVLLKLLKPSPSITEGLLNI